MRYDVEMAASQLFADYLEALCSTGAGQIMDPNGCSIVTFFDPMSIADDDRVVVMVPNAVTDSPDPGCFVATMDIGLKTLWAQATIANDFEVHFARLNDVRDKLMPVDLMNRLTPYLPDGMNLNFIQRSKQFSTHIAESSTAKWIYSGTIFTISGYFSEGD